MADQIFGELRYEDDYGWWGKYTLEFGGNLHTVDILIHDDGEKVISQKQKETYEDDFKCDNCNCCGYWFFHGLRNESGYGWRNTVCNDCRFCLYNPGY